jgi:hypothetical protein
VIFPEGVPELTDVTTGSASISPFQSLAAQRSGPNTPTFNGTNYGMRLHQDLDLIQETLFGDQGTKKEVSCFSVFTSLRK